MKVMVALVLGLSSLSGGVKFDDNFRDTTLRVDLVFTGNSAEEIVTLDGLRAEGAWAGSTANLIDPFGMGRYAVQLYDMASNRLIYARGFDTFFSEYKTTKPAQEGKKRTYHETVLVPMPKRRVQLVLEMRDRHNLYRPVWTCELDPGDYHINRESPRRGCRVFDILTNGDPHRKVDIALVGEGYNVKESEKFESDARRFMDILFSVEPYRRLKTCFNVRGVLPLSAESGVDEPRQGRYRSTALGLTFNSLDSDRYLFTEESRAVRDAAGEVPYDCILVIANMKRYGGGGIYNSFTVFTSDDSLSDYLMLHEFGHGFAGLGDEYYTSDVSYEEFYPKGVEPPDPNLTALLDRENLEWRDLVTPGLPIPTEWGQRTFDSLGLARDSLWRARGAAMRKAGEAPESVKKVGEEYDRRIREATDAVVGFMEHHPLRGKVGAFEGGGYLPKGIYRPTVNSIMHQFNRSDRMYFGVSERAIEGMVRWLCGE